MAEGCRKLNFQNIATDPQKQDGLLYKSPTQESHIEMLQRKKI